jgi:hypothetical protein
MLAVDFDQRRADRLQGLHADRLIVDEGAGAAIGELHAAQDHFAVIVEPVVAEDAAAGWPFGDVEHRGDLALLHAVADQAASPRPPSASAKASSRMDLPAPVSPVSTARPTENSISSRSIRTMSRIDRRASMIWNPAINS